MRKGSKHSEETKKKMSEARLGKKFPDKEKISVGVETGNEDTEL